MATNADNNWVTINGGRFPATIGEEFINTWGKWELDGSDGFKFNDSQATWQGSQYNGSFKDYVGIHSKKNMLYWMEGNYGDKKKEFDFNAWADAHKDEYADYRDENGTWYLTPEARTDLEGRAYTQWLKQGGYDTANTTPVVRIKTGKKEGTQVYYKWDKSLNAYVPYEGKVVYWDTNNGLGHALSNVGGMFLGAIGAVTGNPALSLAGSALSSLGGYGSTKDKLLSFGTSLGLNAIGSGGPASMGVGAFAKGLSNQVVGGILDGMESDKGNLSGIVQQWKKENGKTAGTRPLTAEEQNLINQFASNATALFPGLQESDINGLKEYAEVLARLGQLNEDFVTNTNNSWIKQKEAIEAFKDNTLLGSGGNTSIGNPLAQQKEQVKDSVEDSEKIAAGATLLGALGGGALLGGIGSSLLGKSTMANSTGNSTGNFLNTALGLGVDGYSIYQNYKDKNTFGDLFNQWSNTAGNLVNNNRYLSNSLQNLYDKRAGDNDKLYEALKEKIKVPTRNGDEWQNTPYYTTATQGSQNVNDAMAKALGAADQISGVWNDLGKAKMYGEEDVYDTYRKFANARTQLADRAAALTDSRTYAANRGNGVGTSTVQNEAQAENARKYMADLANIDSQAYTDALGYVTNLSNLQTNQRNAAIAEAVNALNPTITTSTTDAANQLKNSQNEIGALWYGDKAADLERGYMANTYQLGLQNQNAILNALIGLDVNNVKAATDLASGYAGAYGQAVNGLGQSLNKGASDVSSAASGLMNAFGLGAKAVSGAGSLLGSAGSLMDGSNWSNWLSGTGDYFDWTKDLISSGMTPEQALDWADAFAGEDTFIDALGGSGGFWSGIGDSISNGWDSFTGWIGSFF